MPLTAARPASAPDRDPPTTLSSPCPGSHRGVDVWGRGLCPAAVFVNVDRYGNTSAASVPLALCEAFDEGRIKPGDTLAMVAFGAGLTWASAIFKLGVEIPALMQMEEAAADETKKR